MESGPRGYSLRGGHLVRNLTGQWRLEAGAAENTKGLPQQRYAVGRSRGSPLLQDDTRLAGKGRRFLLHLLLQTGGRGAPVHRPINTAGRDGERAAAMCGGGSLCEHTSPFHRHCPTPGNQKRGICRQRHHSPADKLKVPPDDNSSSR